MDANIFKGAENLLLACAGMKSGDKLLILYESADHNFFDATIVDAVADSAKQLGILTTQIEVPFSRDVVDPSPECIARMKAADRSLFLARLGDQIRFRPSQGNIRPIVSYALDADMLASSFGQTDYRAFVEIKDLVNSCLAGAKDIRVTCPLGTNFSGPFADYPTEAADVTVARFPMSVFTPAPATNFSGKVAQKGFLVGTGSQYYDPYACRLEGILNIKFDAGRITGFDGLQSDVDTAKAHFEHVGKLYGIDPYFVHSWHAGIHPGCDYSQPAAANFERWSGGAFGNPRLLHFHTCGAYAPGEISLNILDTTVCVDGVNIWEDGRFYPERIVGGDAIFERFPELRDVFDNPSQNCGLGPDGHLSFD
ncbi:MAG: hypothetical protein COB40_02600 [Marinosulfonomonas sp.]|nr:MAG: hypothetical protein COB40_02600 [Marinosulfonomonas sp.]